LKVSQAVQDAQIARLGAVKAKRNNDEVRQSLAEIKKAAQGTDNLMPAIVTAVKRYATLGEICGVLREVFGEYQESVVL
jgi:methylmalonyl-CoA mutase N-terminal domain/subunit